MMRPCLLTMVLACTVPVFLITELKTALALRAEKITNPPSARTICLFSTNASNTDRSTITETSCGPLNCTTVLSPAANATVPSRANTTPSLRTEGASNAMYPPNAASNVPWFTTEPAAPVPSNVDLPAIKSSTLMFCVVAINPPTLTCELGPNNTPLGLLINTCPLALMLPNIWLPLVSKTRFSVTELAEG